MEGEGRLSLYGIVAGLALSGIVASIAYVRGSLAASGVAGAVVVGTVVFAFGGLGWGLLLIAFFVTSSALSHFRAGVKEPLADKFQKGYRRDIGQVLANGLWGAVLAVAFWVDPQPVWLAAFIGAMATVNADTWATELGVLSPTPPRLVTTGRTVAIGTNGGVTPLGLAAALSGALVIALLAWLLAWMNGWFPIPLFPVLPFAASVPWPTIVLAVGLAGLLGSLFDSFLGATWQAIYYCDWDRKETESALHRCGRPTRLIRGWRWLDNDGVNFLASIVGSGVAAGLVLILM